MPLPPLDASLRFLLGTLALAVVAIPQASGEEQPARAKGPPAWMQEVLQAWSEQHASAAFAQLELQGSPEQIAQRYGELAQHLYNERKDVPAMILAARAGIDFSLRRAEELQGTNEKAACTLRGSAKTIAYNLAANCWPGWNDPGVSHGKAECAIGLDAARLNLHLAQELKRPAEALGNAQWLLGAQLLAAGEHDAAAVAFTRSADHFQEAKKPTEQQMALTYQHLAHRLQHPTDPTHATSLQSSLTALEALKNDDGKFFAEQIRTAEEVFGKK